MEERETAFTTKELSLQLNVGTSTLRKWCISLEKNGYVFTKTTNAHRAFKPADVTALEYIQKLIQVEHFSLTNASKVVVTKFAGNASSSGTLSIQDQKDIAERTAERYNILLNELLQRTFAQNERLDRQEQMLEQIMTHIDKSEEKSSEREQLLLETIEEMKKEPPKKSLWNVASWFR
ncbi:MerR family transcriptional regulator [Alkalicoccus halolimnae]|uniref:MerR family transcriptional regulator n=1 Tax=Alkalicoccus halolimnae TaxID=1667239 RepID=A0A5C7F3Z6_9BACI|nr:MerR family transcriptional regulator [Alkalicoccus halolimnae]TXF82553.1 MerR family transcriptional regulator [Alkalicoccus halolimnae]